MGLESAPAWVYCIFQISPSASEKVNDHRRGAKPFAMYWHPVLRCPEPPSPAGLTAGIGLRTRR